MSTVTIPLSVITMPIPGSKNAPQRFKGNHVMVKPFLEHYDKLLAVNNVTQDSEQCYAILQYCSIPVREIIEGMASFITPDWTQLKSDILKYFDSALTEERFNEQDLISFIKDTRTLEIHSLETFRRYCRQFIRIGGWLLGKTKITADEYNKYFWLGLPKKLRYNLELALRYKTPTLDASKPYPCDDVTSAAEDFLRRDRFDAEETTIHRTARFMDEKFEELEDEEEDDERLDPPIAPARRISPPTVPVHPPAVARHDEPIRRTVSHPEARSTLRSLEKEQAAAQKQDEIEILVKKLNRMSLEDPEYNLLYFKAIKMDGDVKLVVRPPNLHPSQSSQTISPPRIYQNPNSSQQTQAPTFRPSSLTCYGCNTAGHGIRDCPDLLDLISNGRLIRDSNQRLVMPDGRPIRRQGPTETFVQAYHRMAGNAGNGINTTSSSIVEIPTHQSNFVYAERPSTESQVHAAQRQDKSTTLKRKEIFEGVVIPKPGPLSKQKDKENQPIPKVSHPVPAAVPTTIIPIEIQQPTFDPKDDDAIMEDITNTMPAKANATISTEKSKKTRGPAAQSTLMQATNPMDVVGRILNTPLTLPIGDVIGVSKDIATTLQDLIRTRRPNGALNPPAPPFQFKSNSASTNAVNPSFLARPRNFELIYFNVELNGELIPACLDTGSSISLVHPKVHQKCIRLPVDMNAKMNIITASGEKVELQGCVINVPLNVGGAVCYSDLWIQNEPCPFQLLLGRDWQKTNHIDILEPWNDNETYIVIKPDPGSNFRLKVHYLGSDAPSFHNSNITALDESQEAPDSAIFNEFDMPVHSYFYSGSNDDLSANQIHPSSPASVASSIPPMSPLPPPIIDPAINVPMPPPNETPPFESSNPSPLIDQISTSTFLEELAEAMSRPIPPYEGDEEFRFGETIGDLRRRIRDEERDSLMALLQNVSQQHHQDMTRFHLESDHAVNGHLGVDRFNNVYQDIYLLQANCQHQLSVGHFPIQVTGSAYVRFFPSPGVLTEIARQPTPDGDDSDTDFSSPVFQTPLNGDFERSPITLSPPPMPPLTHSSPSSLPSPQSSLETLSNDVTTVDPYATNINNDITWSTNGLGAMDGAMHDFDTGYHTEVNTPEMFPMFPDDDGLDSSAIRVESTFPNSQDEPGPHLHPSNHPSHGTMIIYRTSTGIIAGLATEHALTHDPPQSIHDHGIDGLTTSPHVMEKKGTTPANAPTMRMEESIHAPPYRSHPIILNLPNSPSPSPTLNFEINPLLFRAIQNIIPPPNYAFSFAEDDQAEEDTSLAIAAPIVPISQFFR